MEKVFRRCENIDVDSFGADLILMNLETRRVVVLNEAAAVIWLGLDLCPTREALIELFEDGLPSLDISQLKTSVDATLGSLLEGGFITETSAR